MKYIQWPLLNRARKNGITITSSDFMLECVKGNQPGIIACTPDHMVGIDRGGFAKELRIGAAINIEYARKFERTGMTFDIYNTLCQLPYDFVWFEWTETFDGEKYFFAPLAIRKPDGNFIILNHAAMKNSDDEILDARADIPMVPICILLIGDGWYREIVPTFVGGPKFASELSAAMMHTMAFAIELLSCTNITTVEIGNSKIKHKHRKRVERNPGRLIHKCLVIDPTKSIKRRGSSSGGGGKMAKHMRRGHFADYTKGKGLFGKYKGKYWIPPTVVGDENYGTVIKSYALGKEDE